MKVPHIAKCILCLENPSDSEEHIIPESIGGRFTFAILCKKCNNTLGTELVSTIKADPSIRLAITQLKDEIPDLFEQIENRQEYVGKDIKGNHVKLKYKNAKLRVKAKKMSDSSLIFDTSKIAEIVAPQLKKEGLSENEIAKLIKTIQESEDNKLIVLSETKKIIKHTFVSISPSLENPLMDQRVFALMAYEYLSLFVGSQIYDPKFQFLRDFIRSRVNLNDQFWLGYFRREKYAAYHSIHPKFTDSAVIIYITLFGYLVYEVRLNGFRITAPDTVYLEDLKLKRTFLAQSVDEANKGMFYLLNPGPSETAI